MLIGWREWAALPQLGIEQMKVKIDTGARSSALHAWNIEPFKHRGALWLRFEVHPLQHNNRFSRPCTAPVHDLRRIKSSNGEIQDRYVVRLDICLGPKMWPIDISLTDRDEMGFRMLLGRSAIRNRCLVNPGRSFIVGPPSR